MYKTYFGYDSVHLWLSAEDIPGGIPENKILSALQRLEHRAKQDSDEMYSVGKLQNLNISVRKSGLSVKGSLGKFHAQSGYGLLRYNEIEDCIKHLSKLLGVPMEKAKVTRLDFACDLVMQYPPESYYDYLGQAGHMEREQIGGGLYYSVTERKMVLYDKLKEMRKKGGIVPPELKGKNVLRIELRLLRNLAKQLNTDKLTAATLAAPHIFNQLVFMWQKAYDSILKKRNIKAPLGAMESPRQYEKYLILEGIEANGGIHKELQTIDQLRRENNWCRKQTYRYKKALMEIAQQPNLTYKSRLVQELDLLVKQAAADQQEEI